MTFFMIFALAQGQDAFAGDWQGEIGPGVLNLGVVVHFSQDGEKLSGTIDIPAQGAEAMPLNVAEVNDSSAVFSIAGVPGDPTFNGTLVDGKISGTFSQSGQDFEFSLEPMSADAPAGPATIEAYLGNWQGTIDPGDLDLAVGLTFEDRDGIMQGAIQIPAQSFDGSVKISELTEDGITMVIEGIPGNPTFEGRLESDTISGSFSQGGMDTDFSLQRSDAAIDTSRPQDPSEPYPYRAEEVTYPSGDIEIAGTLTLPEGEGPFPTVILITGSGPQNRNEEIAGHRPFLVLADAITKAGFAVLRTDDRGVGGTGGNLEEANYDVLTNDVLAGLAFLKTRAEIDPGRIGLLGHSEGGYIAPLVASESDDVAFVIMMAGPGVTGLEVLELQNRLLMAQAGASEEEIAGQITYLDNLADALNRDAFDEAKALTEAEIQKSFDAASEEERPDEASLAEIMDAQTSSVVTPYFKSLMLFDPQPYLKQLEVPVLAFYGSKDIQVDAEQSVGPLESALDEAGNTDVTIQVFDGLNHLMQPATTGGLEEYAKIETTIAPEVLELITGWLKERFAND